MARRAGCFLGRRLVLACDAPQVGFLELAQGLAVECELPMGRALPRWFLLLHVSPPALQDGLAEMSAL